MLRLRLAVLFIGLLESGGELSFLLFLQAEDIANNLESVIVREIFPLIERFLNFANEYISENKIILLCFLLLSSFNQNI